MMSNNNSITKDGDIDMSAEEKFMSKFKELSLEEMFEVIALLKKRIRLLEGESN
jgi:hypothetical protein